MTSREPTRLAAERLYAGPPAGGARHDRPGSAIELARYGAVTMFVDRVGLASPASP